MSTIFTPAIQRLEGFETRQVAGRVLAVRGLTVLVSDLPLPIGSIVRIEREAQGGAAHGASCRGEIVGFEAKSAVVMLLHDGGGIAPGQWVVGERTVPLFPVGNVLLGRVIDAMGRPMDGRGPLHGAGASPLTSRVTVAMERQRIRDPLATGVRAIDGMLTLGRGQRIGIFAGPGVGKSTLLSSIARRTDADVNVIALVGERGREVKDFIEEALGPEGLRRSVVIVATSDESPLRRVRAAAAAATVAEHFRDLGSDVLLMMDSITRFAQAQRQVGLAAGEQPATRGYPPSVFAMLPRLLERAGAVEGRGSITGIYTVLVEGDDFDEPISDAAKGVLDGHILLNRKLANRGHFPAISVLESVSRVADDVSVPALKEGRRVLRRLLAAYAENEELIAIKAYASGADPVCDVALRMRGELDSFLQQGRDEGSDFATTCRRIEELRRTAVGHGLPSALVVGPGGTALPR